MTELIAGLSIGLAAGLAPGPLQTLVFTATLQRGFGAGWRVAVAPLLTDAPIVTLAVVAVGALPDDGLRLLGIAGGVAVAAFGVWELIGAHRSVSGTGDSPSGDLWRGAIANALSPHPWLFWALAGGPLLVDAWSEAPGRAVAFLVGFYGTLVGSKLALAAVVATGRERLPAAWRRRLVVAGGALLILGGVTLVWNWA